MNLKHGSIVCPVCLGRCMHQTWSKFPARSARWAFGSSRIGKRPLRSRDEKGFLSESTRFRPKKSERKLFESITFLIQLLTSKYAITTKHDRKMFEKVCLNTTQSGHEIFDSLPPALYKAIYFSTRSPVHLLHYCFLAITIWCSLFLRDYYPNSVSSCEDLAGGHDLLDLSHRFCAPAISDLFKQAKPGQYDP